MHSDTEQSPPVQTSLRQAERTFQAFAPHLWPWTGWYALVVADRFVGVFPTLWDAISAGQASNADPDGVLVRRIGSDDATPVPVADGGVIQPTSPWAQ